MRTDHVTGFLLILIAAVMNGAYAIPMKFMSRWKWENIWLVGGGSGHGFKHGPLLGEYVAARVTETRPAKNEIEPRFSLATKQTIQNRSVH